MKKQLLNIIIGLGMILGSTMFVGAMNQNEEVLEVQLGNKKNPHLGNLEKGEEVEVKVKLNIEKYNQVAENLLIEQEEVLEVTVQDLKNKREKFYEKYEQICQKNKEEQRLCSSKLVGSVISTFGFLGAGAFFTIACGLVVAHLVFQGVVTTKIIEKTVAWLTSNGIEVSPNFAQMLIKFETKSRAQWFNFLQKDNKLALTAFFTEIFIAFVLGGAAALSFALAIVSINVFNKARKERKDLVACMAELDDTMNSFKNDSELLSKKENNPIDCEH